ncbi:MAG: GNAT family N-acetyltransferase [Myxococcota bacterium]
MSDVIRAVSAHDWPGLLEVERARYGDGGYDRWFVRMIPLLFARTTWVAEAPDGSISGYALGALEDRDASLGWLMSVAVRQDGTGLGTRLTARCVAGLEAVGARRIRLTVAPDNVRALKVYEALGFVAVGFERDYFGPGTDRVVMERATPVSASV